MAVLLETFTYPGHFPIRAAFGRMIANLALQGAKGSETTLSWEVRKCGSEND